MKSNSGRVHAAGAAGAMALALTVGSIGCGDDEDPPIDEPRCEVTPGAWSSDGFDTNAADALALRGQISALQGTLLNTAEQTAWGNTPAAPPDMTAIMAAYDGTPSIRDVTAPALDAVIQQSFADWTDAMEEDPAVYEFIDADGLNWIASGAGGVHERPPATDGTRRFRAYSAGGTELRQIIDKGLFVGALYNYALGLTEGTITPATIQAIAAAWGSNPGLVVNPAETEPQNDDTANYARTMGLYDDTATALIAAQAYAADELCTAERDAALVDVFRLWEEAAFARGTYYANEFARATLDPTDPETVLGPLHGASEGYGLIAGMLGIPDPSSGPLAGGARISSDADVETALGALGLDLEDLSAGTTGEWVVEAPATYNSGFTGAFKTTVVDLFGWSDAQFTEYATAPVASE